VDTLSLQSPDSIRLSWHFDSPEQHDATASGTSPGQHRDETSLSSLAGAGVLVGCCSSRLEHLSRGVVGAPFFPPEQHPDDDKAAAGPLFVSGEQHPDETTGFFSHGEVSELFFSEHSSDFGKPKVSKSTTMTTEPLFFDCFLRAARLSHRCTYWPGRRCFTYLGSPLLPLLIGSDNSTSPPLD
jgi:hypothetical protein